VTTSEGYCLRKDGKEELRRKELCEGSVSESSPLKEVVELQGRKKEGLLGVGTQIICHYDPNWLVESEQGVGGDREPLISATDKGRVIKEDGGLQYSVSCEGSPGLHSSSVEAPLGAGFKAWKVKKIKPSVTLGRDIGMEIVGSYMSRGLVGRFKYGAVVARDIHEWVESTWGTVVGYKPVVLILVKGWFCFLFQMTEDAETSLEYGLGGEVGRLMLKQWNIAFNPGKGTYEV
jgi:hypothetical protein